jgi:transposase
MDLKKLHLHWGACKRGRKIHKSYSLARSFRQDGKNRKETVVKLGKLTEEEAEQWRRLLQAAKTDANVADLVVLANYSHLDVAVMLEMWNFWGLSEVFDAGDERERTVPLSSLAAVLAMNRCVDPASKSRATVWFQQTALPFLLNVPPCEMNPSRVFRELPRIEACKDAIAQHLCKKMKEHYPEAMKEFFYDLSSTTFHGSRCMLMRWGYCKEGYENHIVLALIVNTAGLPIYWEVLPGSTADVTTICWLLDRLKTKLPIPIPTMVFDRGMVSDDNLSLLETGEVKYISAMDRNQIEEIANVDFSKFKNMTPDDIELQMGKRPDFIRLDKTTYCKEACVRNNRRYVLCFNAQLFRDQRNARMEQLANLASFVEEQNKELLLAQKCRGQAATQDKFNAWLRKANLQKFVKVQLEEKYVPKQTKKMLKAIQSWQAKILVDEEGKLTAGRLDGFWLLVTNHVEKNGDRFIQDTQAVVRPYREKVVIESSFRDIKSFLEISPVHVWKPEHVRAHYTICVLAHLIDRTLALRLHKSPGNDTADIVSHERLYEELSECRLNHIRPPQGQSIYTLTEPKTKHGELLGRLGMSHLIGDAALSGMNF